MFTEISKITNLLQIFNKLIHDTIFTHQINYNISFSYLNITIIKINLNQKAHRKKT